MSDKLIIPQGTDRYGAHIVRSILDFIYFKDEELFFSKKFKYYNRVFFEPFKVLCKYCEDQPKMKLHQNNRGVVNHMIIVLKKLMQDIPSYFEENHKKQFLNILEPKLSNIKLVWNNPEKILCIHLRLDDEAKYIPKYKNLYKQATYVREYINNGCIGDIECEKNQKKVQHCG